MEYAAIIAAAAAAIGALVAAGQNAQAMEMRQRIADQYTGLPLPVLDQVVAEQLPPDSAARYTASTQSTQAESNILGKYMNEVNSGGETAQDRAAYLRMNQQAGGIANSAQGAVQRNMAQRGMAGSGLSYAMQEQGAQSAANNANANGVKEAADSRQRYMDALAASGTMSGNMRAQELSALKSQDEINMFNATQRTNAANQNNQLKQTAYENRLQKLSGQSNAMNGVANQFQSQATTANSVGAGVGNAALAYGAATSSDKPTPINPGRGSASDLSGGHTDTTDALTSSSTRPPAAGYGNSTESDYAASTGAQGQRITGYDQNGQPVYGW